jgi:predicted transcriptional regulator
MNSESKSQKSGEVLKSQILNYIRVHPGESFVTIRAIFNIPDSTLRYHIRDLEKKGQIKSDIQKRIYFPIEQKAQSSLSDIQNKIIYKIKRQPGITQKELAKSTKLNRATIRYNINILLEKEIVSIEKIGKKIQHFYVYPEQLQKEKILRLITKLLLGKIDEETYWELRRTVIEDQTGV